MEYAFDGAAAYEENDDVNAAFLEADGISLAQSLGLEKRNEFGEWRSKRAIEVPSSPHEERCASLLTRIRNKIMTQMATGEQEMSAGESDYLEPDSDSETIDECVRVRIHSGVKRKREDVPDMHNMFLGRALDFDPLSLLPPPILPPHDKETMVPLAYPLPFMCLPVKGYPKCILPSMPHPAVKKYNHRSIYNCVRCGQMKKFHACSFPENVRSVGTSMSTSTTPRDNVSRYYKCGRVLVCKKK